MPKKVPVILNIIYWHRPSGTYENHASRPGVGERPVTFPTASRDADSHLSVSEIWRMSSSISAIALAPPRRRKSIVSKL